MKRWMCTLAVIAVIGVLTGWDFSEKTSSSLREAGSLKKLGKDEKVTIKVMYYDKNSFYQQYGNLFMVKNPNVGGELTTSEETSDCRWVPKNTNSVVIMNLLYHKAII
ncbi:hypothetical protein ASG89_23395 [Paenibacillus sp. Soil766]|uniref:hypothetical protein n=1 Tax=Paenibacillus sp. Soil766 TaxID=1736404 RepID=UPI00070DD765|nr:hypothetical protein [Paenibacillus sp. Soil766]KRF03387.1 hypothetical protein ASG89_23395 [Paenibacillus sp. Soil766]